MKWWRYFLCLALWLVLATPAQAFTMKIFPDCAWDGSCQSLDDVLQVVANIAQILLGLSASVVLLMFVWGGFELVLSRGSADMAKSGKARMTNAIIGLIIAFLAMSIVRGVEDVLQVNKLVNLGSMTTCTKDADCGTDGKCDSSKHVCTRVGGNGTGGAMGRKCDTDADCAGLIPGVQGLVCVGAVSAPTGPTQCKKRCEGTCMPPSTDGICQSTDRAGQRVFQNTTDEYCGIGLVCCPR